MDGQLESAGAAAQAVGATPAGSRLAATERLVPPRPPIPRSVPPWYWPTDILRLDPLCVWPEAAYEADTYLRNFLGLKRRLLNAPEMIRHVMIDNIANYRRAPGSVRILQTFSGRGLLIAEGEEWKFQRRTVAPALTPRNVPVLVRHVVTAASETVAELRAQAGQPADLLGAVQEMALEIAARSMFSLEMREHGPALRDTIVRFALGPGRASLLDMVLPGWIPAPRDFERRRFQARWMRLIEQLVELRARAAVAGAPRDLFDLLLAARDPDTGAPLTRQQLRDQVATLIGAGHETTGLTLFWALYLLAQAPWAQQRLADEAAEVDIDPESAMQAVPRLIYTRAVISEALRLYPVAYTMSRRAIADDHVAGVDIPAGSQVVVLPWLLHRHRRYWRDPDAFDPTRFLPDAPPPDRFAYLPFSIGPRVCAGAAFAMAEAVLVLAMLIRAFRVELLDTEPVLPVASLTLRPNRAAKFRLHPRETA